MSDVSRLFLSVLLLWVEWSRVGCSSPLHSFSSASIASNSFCLSAVTLNIDTHHLASPSTRLLSQADLRIGRESVERDEVKVTIRSESIVSVALLIPSLLHAPRRRQVDSEQRREREGGGDVERVRASIEHTTHDTVAAAHSSAHSVREGWLHQYRRQMRE